MNLETLLSNVEAQLKAANHVDGKTSVDFAQAHLNGAYEAIRLVRMGLQSIESNELASLTLTPSKAHSRSRIYRSEPDSSWKISDTSASHVLERVKDSLKINQGSPSLEPAVIVDLDGTLFNVSHRTLGIVHEWAKIERERNRFSSPLVSRIAKMGLDHIGYNLGHAFENLGVDLADEELAELYAHAESYWRKRFFDGSSLVLYDKPIAGGREFLHQISSLGVSIIYLTGRHERVMNDGTQKQLKENGFPTGNQLILKRQSQLDDVTFKSQTVERLSKKFRLLGNFENEYCNLFHMSKFMPSSAVHVILDTQHSGRHIAGSKLECFRIPDFL